MSYRKYNVSKISRIKHKKREKKRKAEFDGLASFAYTDCRHRSKKGLSSGMGKFH